MKYKYYFPVEPDPVTLAIDEENRTLYILNHHPWSEEYSSKIQKFSLDGKLKDTFVDLSSFTEGKFAHYIPIDFCIDDNSIYLLTTPQDPVDDYWLSYDGFCVLTFDINGNYIHEYDLSEIEEQWHFSSIAASSKYLYVSGVFIMKRINKIDDSVTDIQIPTTNDRLPFATDMEIKSEKSIYITSQYAHDFDTSTCDYSGCFISELDIINQQHFTFYSTSRTGVCAAMLNNPGLAIKENGNIYIATYYGQSIEVYDSTGVLISMVMVETTGKEVPFPIDLALYNDKIYVADNRNNAVLVYEEQYRRE